MDRETVIRLAVEHELRSEFGVSEFAYLDRLERFAAAVEANCVPKWQPIETAPITRDSLLIRRNGEICIANWGDYDEVNQPKFTHWMPLPSAPAPKEES